MATIYGNTVNSRWCAYMNYSTTETATTMTLTVECCLQVNNYSLSYNGVTGDVSIDFDANSSASARKSINKNYGSGITYYSFCTASKTFTKTKNAQSKSFSAGVTFGSGSGYWPGTSRAYGTITVPAIDSYTVSYNANGGSGSPSPQTKWYNETLVLSTTKPSRTGYTFSKWSTTFSSGNVTFNPGGTYTYNSPATLYAVWDPNIYTITYNANSGEFQNGTGSLTEKQTYGENYYITKEQPTRRNYTFIGWATSPDATTAIYTPGQLLSSYYSVTLYAVWLVSYVEPRITNLVVDRCSSDGTLREEGQYAKVTFDWAVDKTISAITIECDGVTTLVSGTGSESAGSVSSVIGANNLNTDNEYLITVTVSDSIGSSIRTTKLAPLSYIIDFSPHGGIGIGLPAPNEKRLEIGIHSKFDTGVVVNDYIDLSSEGNTFRIETTPSNQLAFSGPTVNHHIYLLNNEALAGQLTSGSWSSMLRMNTENQVELNWTNGGLKGRVMKELWSGTWSRGNITVAEMSYYHIYLFVLGNGSHIIASRIDSSAYIRGSSQSYAGSVWIDTLQCVISGTTLSGLYAYSTPINNGVNQTKTTVTRIYGIV